VSDIKLFQLEDGGATEIPGASMSLEKSLQTLIEHNLEAFLGIRFLETEYSTGAKHKGRIDTLGIDENGAPVIIEYKRAANENVINQGLFYLDWLMDHRAEFELLVMKKLGDEVAKKIDWSAPRLLCIAGAFNRYDEHAVMQMNRNIELIRYRRFGDGLLLFELVNAVSAEEAPVDTGGGGSDYKTFGEVLEGMKGPLRDIYDELRVFLMALGDDVQAKELKYYCAFKRIKNFACVELHPSVGYLKAYVKVDPDEIEIDKGFTRDVREIGHFGTGDLEITIKTRGDIEKARHLFEMSYEAS
jgi:predicted transport protein